MPIPPHWAFLIADSGVRAEKSGGAREEYNARRAAGSAALARLGLASYFGATPDMAERLEDRLEHDAFLHITTEETRVRRAVQALGQDDLARFGELLVDSHASLRHRLRVSCPELDRLVKTALRHGAGGARLTGAGFGGSVVIACERDRVAQLRAAIPNAVEAEPGNGARMGVPEARPTGGLPY